jgi:hypothetical protein
MTINKEERITEAKIVFLTSDGDMRIEFNRTMHTRNVNISNLNSTHSFLKLAHSRKLLTNETHDLMEIYVKPYGYPIHNTRVNLTWTVVDYNAKHLDIKVDFRNASQVSPNQI